MSFAEVQGLVLAWAEEKGLLKQSNYEAQLEKLKEEFTELYTAPNKVGVIDGIGDMMIVLTLMAYFQGTSLDICYRKAYWVIKDRKGKIVDGKFVKDDS